MTDFESMRVSGSSFGDFARSLTKVIQALPPEMGERLHRVGINYFALYGIEGWYERMNDRTVAQIFAEYRPADVKPIASGEVDGVRYVLYDAPPSRGVDGEHSAEE